jgi:hypothetical protein
MKTSRLVLLALLFISGTAICRANLGETEAQCIARYGSESEVQTNLGFDAVGDKRATFNFKTPKGSLIIGVIFLNGVAVLERMTSADPSGEIPDDQKQAIFNTESAGLQWQKQKTTYQTDRSDVTTETETWLRSDGTNATCWMSGKVNQKHGWNEIDLATAQYTAAQRALDQQDGAR